MKGCMYEIDDADAFRGLFRWISCSFLCVVSSFDDFSADLGEEPIN